MISGEELKDLLDGCYGSENYYRLNPISKMIITDGVKLFAEKANAYWLLSDISIDTVFRKNLRVPFLGISLKVEKGRGKLEYDDGNGKILYKHSYAHTDCPEGKWEFFLIDNVLMLPSEY